MEFGCVCNNAITLYECDPALNTACMHKWCAVDHPDDPKAQCHRTMHPEFARKGTRPVQIDLKTGAPNPARRNKMPFWCSTGTPRREL